MLAANVLALGGVAHFEAQTYQPATPFSKCYFVQI